MKLGANSVLFGGHDLEVAFRVLKAAGYDGIEISAINGMSQHLVISEWRDYAPKVKRLAAEYDFPLLAMEQPNTDAAVMEEAFQAAVECGIPVINTGPGGKSGEPGSLEQRIEVLGVLARRAEHYGVTLCVKAHVGNAIDNTETTLRALAAINSPAFGCDMDPSHIYRAGENPVEALRQVIHRVKHVHIRDCTARTQGPGKPEQQANGRGSIDLAGYLRVLHENGYTGAVNLEVIGARDYTVEQCAIIAAEARGHMQACLQACGARRA
ncbi:MAG TPA: sugar phosphate isomerase/epimerase [Candidatus Methylacidiphilales bacterium]|nr:sugar phosphate isomerase/epimerase [Candidatus Methylacidiphilales bacterium]